MPTLIFKNTKICEVLDVQNGVCLYSPGIIPQKTVHVCTGYVPVSTISSFCRPFSTVCRCSWMEDPGAHIHTAFHNKVGSHGPVCTYCQSTQNSGGGREDSRPSRSLLLSSVTTTEYQLHVQLSPTAIAVQQSAVGGLLCMQTCGISYRQLLHAASQTVMCFRLALVAAYIK